MMFEESGRPLYFGPMPARARVAPNLATEAMVEAIEIGLSDYILRLINNLYRICGLDVSDSESEARSRTVDGLVAEYVGDVRHQIKLAVEERAAMQRQLLAFRAELARLEADLAVPEAVQDELRTDGPPSCHFATDQYEVACRGCKRARGGWHEWRLALRHTVLRTVGLPDRALRFFLRNVRRFRLMPKGWAPAVDHTESSKAVDARSGSVAALPDHVRAPRDKENSA